MTATAVMGEAQTQTAEPTLTPSLTPTPTLPPTITPSPTPLIPNVQGRIQINFLPVDDETIIPQPPHEVSMNLVQDEKEIDVQAATSDGKFSVPLEPGAYRIRSVTIRNEALNSDEFQIFTNQPEFTVPSQTCFHAGTISFFMLRLPPGSLEEQTSLAQQLTSGEDIFIKYSESGGILMPALVEILGKGDCPDLPNLPNSYDWRYLPESSLAVPSPADWFFLSEQDRPNWSYFISKEEIIDGGIFNTGWSIYVISDDSINADEFVNDFPSGVINQGNVINSSEVEVWDDDHLAFSEFQIDARGVLFDFTSHYLIAANRDTNIQYFFIFEGPTDQWDEAWEIGKILMENIQFLDSN